MRAGTFAAGAEIGAAAGAELDLSEVALPAGVVLRGPGTFVLASPAARDGALRRDAPVFRFVRAGEARDLAAFGDVVPAVVGRPAIWFDAARNVDALAFDWTENDGAVRRYANGVACWRDCRAGETAFYATNDFSQIATDGVPCVPARLMERGGWPCLLFEGLPFPGESNYRKSWSGMVWNRPITNVCAVFHVVWAPPGGPAVLGCTRRFEEMGDARERNDFLRGVTANQGGGVGTANNRLLNAEAADCVRAGWIYGNGVRKAAETAEDRSGIYLLEYHPRAPYGRADAFAVQEHAGVTASGCQASFECLVYTNALSMAERRQVCAYLMEKYGIAKSSGDLLAEPRFEGTAALEPAADADEGVEVAAGQLLGVSSLTNGHVLVKTGAGRMYVDYVGGGSGLDVREGALVVQSRELTGADVPAGAFVHLDATATNRMLLTARGPDGASPYPDGVARTEEDRRQYLTIIRDKTRDLQALVNKLFLFSRMDLGQNEDHPEPVSLAEELTLLHQVLAPEYAGRGLALTLTCAGPGEGRVLADPDTLHRVVANIAENSAKYGAAALNIALREEPSFVSVTFTDDGPGVPPEAMRHIFDAFYRADPARNEKIAGSGLGLAIVSRAVRNMKGRIIARNVQPHGLLLEIQLPKLETEG